MTTTKQEQHFENKLDELFEGRILPANVSFYASSDKYQKLGYVVKTNYGFLILYRMRKTVATSTAECLTIIESFFASDPETDADDSLVFSLGSEDFALALLKDQWDAHQVNFLKELVRREGVNGVLDLPDGVRLSMMADSGPDMISINQIKIQGRRLLFECEDDDGGSYTYMVNDLPESACYYIIDQWYQLKD